jgi:hypothetical protein
MSASATISLVAIQTAHFLPVSNRTSSNTKHFVTMSNNQKTYSTFDEKHRPSTDEASIRSTSTMSSLKNLLPKKGKAPSDKERMSQEKAVRREATATYLAYR